MKNLKAILTVIVLSTTVYSSEILKNTFIDVSKGYTYTPYNKKDLVGSININSLDKNGYLYDFGIGYRFSENIFSTLNYQYSKLDEMSFDDYYLTLNYQLDYELNPYFGVLIGKSFLNWEKDPINSARNIDWSSGSMLYGIQTGFEYQFSEKFSLVPKLIYIRTDHGANLISLPARSYIEHDSKTQLMLGLRYNF